MTNTQWRELGDIPPQYHPYFTEGADCRNKGTQLNNPYPDFTNRRHAFRAGWWHRHNEIKQFGEIK